ncbi:MAG: IPT/TIG domain-containing protein [Myxococcales bacterium]|nr:IPT/TIG domain-containing protein [Myxococcales bacterium]
MIRSHSALLACLALSVACASQSKGSNDPNAGQYDGYYDENGDAAGTSTADGGTKTPVGPRPKARASTATRGGAKRTGKSIALVPTKPPVSGGDKPHKAPKDLKSEFGVDGFFPTYATVGSLIEVYGSGFPEDANKAKVFIGGKQLEVVELTPDRIVAKVGANTTGVVEVGMGTGRTNRRNRAKTTTRFTATAADGAFGQPRTEVGHGLLGLVYEVGPDVQEVPNFNDLGAPVAFIGVDDLDIPSGAAAAGVAGRGQSFGIHFQGSLNIVEAGEYELCLTAGDGALLFLDQTPIIDNDGSGAAREVCEVLFVEPGEYGLDLLYYQGADTDAGLTLTWSKDGGAKEPVPAQAFFPPETLRELAVGNEQAAAG